jgi:AraC family transcriptional regulator
MNGAEKTTAEEFRKHIPGELESLGSGPAWTDILVEVHTRNRVEDSILVPAVAEPLIVLIVSGSALVEEREIGGEWSGKSVSAGDFFLTTSPTPYELRWQVTSREPFRTCHVYIGLPTFARAMREILGVEVEVPVLREIYGQQDATLSAFIELLRGELALQKSASPLYISGLAQSLAIHLVRNYHDPDQPSRARRGELPAFKLRKIIALLESGLDEEFELASLAEEAGMSEFHFSRVFKKTTGLSPSQYFTRLRMDKARQLLRETKKSVIEIGLEVGYSSPSHFAQIFRREVGVTPSQYRGHD